MVFILPYSDNDGLSDGDEVNVYQANVWMSDRDGMPDMWELGFGLNPIYPSRSKDADIDTIDDWNEYKAGTSPIDPDSKPWVVEQMLVIFETQAMPDFLTVPDNANDRWAITDSKSQQGRYSLGTNMEGSTG